MHKKELLSASFLVHDGLNARGDAGGQGNFAHGVLSSQNMYFCVPRRW